MCAYVRTYKHGCILGRQMRSSCYRAWPRVQVDRRRETGKIMFVGLYMRLRRGRRGEWGGRTRSTDSIGQANQQVSKRKALFRSASPRVTPMRSDRRQVCMCVLCCVVLCCVVLCCGSERVRPGHHPSDQPSGAKARKRTAIMSVRPRGAR
ncbi:hypothetical protein F5B18DRAFT_146517 [Nemania serpens]|nr:hypothetical protein F5B18DRAFT_146517 [Nemania serpens]